MFWRKKKKKKTFEMLCNEVLDEFGILEFQRSDFLIEYFIVDFPIISKPFYNFKCTWVNKGSYTSSIHLSELPEVLIKTQIREVVGGCINGTKKNV